MRNLNIKRHSMASVLIIQAPQKRPCGANHIAYTGIGSADNLAEQGLDLRNTANKTLPYCFLPNLTTLALKASSRDDAILFLLNTVCSSQMNSRNSDFQQLAKDKKLNPNQWEVHLIEFFFIYNHKSKMCTAIQLGQQQSRCGSGCHGTQPP